MTAVLLLPGCLVTVAAAAAATAAAAAAARKARGIAHVVLNIYYHAYVEAASKHIETQRSRQARWFR